MVPIEQIHLSCMFVHCQNYSIKFLSTMNILEFQTSNNINLILYFQSDEGKKKQRKTAF